MRKDHDRGNQLIAWRKKFRAGKFLHCKNVGAPARFVANLRQGPSIWCRDIRPLTLIQVG